MYNINHTHSFADLAKFDKFFVGSDKFISKMSETLDTLAKTASATYPPFNLKKIDDNKYVIELAVAGFAKQDIEIVLENGKLVIKGSTTLDTLTEDGVNVTYLHKGISDRAFTRTFSLADDVVVNSAEMVNGMLKVWLEHIIPEEKKPKKISITDHDGKKKHA